MNPETDSSLPNDAPNQQSTRIDQGTNEVSADPAGQQGSETPVNSAYVAQKPGYTQQGSPTKLQTSALVGFILAMSTFYIPFIPLIAIIVSIVGLRSVKKNQTRGKGLAIAGIVISLVVLVFQLLLVGVYFNSVESDEVTDSQVAKVKSISTEYFSNIESSNDESAYSMLHPALRLSQDLESFRSYFDVYREYDLLKAKPTWVYHKNTNVNSEKSSIFCYLAEVGNNEYFQLCTESKNDGIVRSFILEGNLDEVKTQTQADAEAAYKQLFFYNQPPGVDSTRSSERTL